MTQILPQDATAAVQKVIALANNLLTLLESENRAIAMNDGIGFSVTEPDKVRAADQYAIAAAEFMQRRNEFSQSVAPSQFEELLALQGKLKAAADANNIELGKLPGVNAAND